MNNRDYNSGTTQLSLFNNFDDNDTNVQSQKSVIPIQYDSIQLSENVKTQINNKIGDNKSLPIQEFVKAAGLNNVVATVSIPSDNSQISILDIKMGDNTIYPLTQGGSKSTKRGGGRKSRVSYRRGGRKSRRRHNYI